MSDFAIIKTGGKQYKVKVGDTLKVEKIRQLADQKSGKIELTDILEGKKVFCEVLKSGKYPKVRVLKFHPKKRYKRNKGHRQAYSEIKITKIS